MKGARPFLGPLVFLLLWVSCVAGSKCVETFVRRAHGRVATGLGPRSPADGCRERCARNPVCKAFQSSQDSCHILEEAASNDEAAVIVDPEWSIFRKVCLKGHQCPTRFWSFEAVPGFRLQGYEDKTVPEAKTEEACAEACVSELSFQCRSAQLGPAGLCVLSSHDRRTAPEGFIRASGPGEVYLENQCVKEPGNCTFVPRRVTGGLRGPSVTVQGGNCLMACLAFSGFTCRAYVQSGDSCLLSPEDSHSLGLLEDGPTAVEVFERASCIEVAMKCDATHMTAIIKVRTPYRGRVYALGHPYDCYSVSVSSAGEVVLQMPLHGPRCGTHNLGNGTFTNSVVVQHHPYVLKSTDRRIDVACDFDEVKRRVRGGKQVTEGELPALLHTVTGVAPAPPVRLRVVRATGEDVTGVELGEPLFLLVELLDQDSVFGISGRGLVANSGQGAETVMLLDDEGCPLEPAVFPKLEPLPGSKSLSASFQAFRFASDSSVKFQMTVSFCLDACPKVNCSSESKEQSSPKDRKKRRSLDTSHHSGDVISDLTMESPPFQVTSLRTAPSPLAGPLASTAEQHGLDQSGGICLSETTLVTWGVVVAAFQLVLLAGCGLALARSRADKSRRFN